MVRYQLMGRQPVGAGLMRIKRNSQLCVRVLAVVSCLLLIACGGGGGLQFESLPDAADNPAAPTVEIPVTGEPVPLIEDSSPPAAEPVNKLVLSVPDLSGLAPGSEFEVSLAGAFSGEVYQGSARLLFNPAYLKPVQAQRGGMLLTDMVHLASLDQDGFVPFAFTGLPGHNAMAPGTGELLRVKFRILQAGAEPHRIRLQNDAEFLQLRDRNSRRLKFELESRAGVAQ